MDKLEHYLDQVCRGIAGPRSLRQHIRQELREHLMDAVSEHENAGVTHEAAIDRALEEFGGPDEVRRELEATHGHRLMAVVVDKAMQWKEKTMKAKWLWTTWAHLMLGLILVLEVLFILGAQSTFVQHVWGFDNSGWLSPSETTDFCRWVFQTVANWLHDWAWWVTPLVLLWAVFEWRVRSEKKSMIRLALMGTAAVKLLVVTILISYALVWTMFGATLVMNQRDPGPVVAAATYELSIKLAAAEQSMQRKEWDATRSHLIAAAQAMTTIATTGGAPYVLLAQRSGQKLEDISTQLTDASTAMRIAPQMAYFHDAAAVEAAIRKARAATGLASPTTATLTN